MIGSADMADGAKVLKVAVTAVPENGKANDALLRLLAKSIDVPRTSLSIRRGATDRRKTVCVAGDPDSLWRHLTSL